jgi:hypothetical protein
MSKSIALALVLCAFFPPHIVKAQTPQQDPTLAQLQDSITRLLQTNQKLVQELQDHAPVLADFDDVESSASDNRVHINVDLNRIGRVRVILHGMGGGSYEKPQTSADFKLQHSVVFTDVPAGTYWAEVRILNNGVGMTESTRARQGEDASKPGWDPSLRLPVSGTGTPLAIVPGAPQVNGTIVTIPVPTSVQALVRGTLYPVNAAGQPMLNRPLAADGDVLTKDPKTGKPSATGNEATYDASTTLQFRGLQGQTSYAYVVEALTETGSEARSPVAQFRTGDPPSEFGFSGPINIRINPVTGLVLRWNALTPAASGSVTVGAGPTYPASLSTDHKTLQVDIPRTALPATPAAGAASATPPTLTVRMVGEGTGPQRNVDFTVGVETPTAAQIDALPTKQERDAMRDVAQAVSGVNAAVNWNSVISSVLRVVATKVGVPLPTLP